MFPSGQPTGPDAIDDEAVEAAEGEVVARLTRSLNSDANDTGTIGAEVVEVYQQLRAGNPEQPVGVLEVYLPYAPISRDVASGLSVLYRVLIAGLAPCTARWLRSRSRSVGACAARSG